MTARDELLAVLRRSGYSQQRAVDLVDRATAAAQKIIARGGAFCGNAGNGPDGVGVLLCAKRPGHGGLHTDTTGDYVWRGAR